MGQYYIGVLGDSDGEFKNIRPYDQPRCYGCAKLMEHSWWNNGYVNWFAEKLYLEIPQRLAWVGDYSNLAPKPCPAPVYDAAWSSDNIPEIEAESDFALDGKYFLNFSKKQYLDLSAYFKRVRANTDPDDWVPNPIPLLTCFGNGEGGGDYFGSASADAIGSWAWDVVSIEDECPHEDWQEIKPTFYE